MSKNDSSSRSSSPIENLNENCCFNLNFSNPGGDGIQSLLLSPKQTCSFNEMAAESEESTIAALQISLTNSTPTTSSLEGSSSGFLSQRSKNLTNLLPNGKKTKGRVKIKMEYIENKLRRYTTFSKRKTGIMKKAHELSTLTGTQVMLLVASETGHVYAFATNKLKPMISSDQGKALIQRCLNAPDDQFLDLNGAIKTEFTFEPLNSGCLTPTNPRKRKLAGNAETMSLPTMVPSNCSINDGISVSGSSPFIVDEFCCGESDDSYEVENDDDDEENDEENENEESEELAQTSFSTLLNRNNSNKSEALETNKKGMQLPTQQTNKFKPNSSNNARHVSKPMKWTTSTPQTMLKDALKAAADQRQRQKKLAVNSNGVKNFNRSKSPSLNNRGASSNSNSPSVFQQQLSALLPMMLQASSFNSLGGSSTHTNSNRRDQNDNGNESNGNGQNDESNSNPLQQLFGSSFGNFSTVQQVLATMAMSQLAENSKS